jgi:broad specificity phosphatase PhoE
MHTRLVLIRHGASKHSAQQIIAGMRACTGLTDEGVEQAHALANRLRATEELSDCGVLLSSPALRARQTAEILLTFDIPRPGTRAWLEPIHTSLTEWSVSDTTWMLTRYNNAGHRRSDG